LIGHATDTTKQLSNARDCIVRSPERARMTWSGFSFLITGVLLNAVAQLLLKAGTNVLGVITPESALAVEATRNGRIGLLATPATVASGAYTRAVRRVSGDVELHAVSCPDLAPIIQGGLGFDQQVVDTVRSYCHPLRDAGVDTVILGCTHYPLVRPMLQRTLGRGVVLVSAAEAVARRVEHALDVHELRAEREGEGDYRFLCTGDVDAFRSVGTRFLQMPLNEIAHVELPAEVAA